MRDKKAKHELHSTKRQAEAITQKNVETVAEIQRKAESSRTFGERAADGFARAIGSWPFIIAQSVLLVLWIAANVMHFLKPWDPYPFILLNLALSFQAAYASPIIMMSQNRQTRLADERNHLALQIALLAEQEDTESLLLLRKISEHLKISHVTPEEKGLEQKTNPSLLLQQIKKAEDKGTTH